MSPPTRPIFLERHGYRQRRLIDAARLLPVLGVILLAVPMLWPQADVGAAGLGEGGAGDGLPTSRAIIYIFLTWAGLALVSALLVRALPAEAVDRLDGGGPPGGLPPLPSGSVELPGAGAGLAEAVGGEIVGGHGLEVPGSPAETGHGLGAGRSAAGGADAAGSATGPLPAGASAGDGPETATPTKEAPRTGAAGEDSSAVSRGRPGDGSGGAG